MGKTNLYKNIKIEKVNLTIKMILKSNLSYLIRNLTNKMNIRKIKFSKYSD